MTARDILSVSLALMGEDPAGTAYDTRGLWILNLMLPEVFEKNNCLRGAQGLPALTEIPTLSALSDEVPMDARVSRTVLPLGLAARLLIGSDIDRALYFNNEYLAKSKELTAAGIEPIGDRC